MQSTTCFQPTLSKVEVEVPVYSYTPYMQLVRQAQVRTRVMPE